MSNLSTVYCIYFNFTDDFINQQREWLANNPSEEKVEVAIQYNDKTVNFTFEEFLDKCGLR